MTVLVLAVLCLVLLVPPQLNVAMKRPRALYPAPKAGWDGQQRATPAIDEAGGGRVTSQAPGSAAPGAAPSAIPHYRRTAAGAGEPGGRRPRGLPPEHGVRVAAPVQ